MPEHDSFTMQGSYKITPLDIGKLRLTATGCTGSLVAMCNYDGRNHPAGQACHDNNTDNRVFYEYMPGECETSNGGGGSGNYGSSGGGAPIDSNSPEIDEPLIVPTLPDGTIVNFEEDIARSLAAKLKITSKAEIKYLIANSDIVFQIESFLRQNNDTSEVREFAKLALEALKNGLEKDNINFEDKIINELAGPVKDIFEILDHKSISTSSILQNIYLFFGNSYRENNVTYKLAKQPLNVNGITKRSETSNTSYIITINSEHIYDRAPIEIARTILHESIHAYTMMHQVTSSESFYEIFKAYLKIEKGEDKHHTIMAQEYIIPMANALKSFDNNQEDDILYTYLAWRGIPVNLRDPSITDQMINDAIIIFRARGLTTD